jgi:hypothetical protein
MPINNLTARIDSAETAVIGALIALFAAFPWRISDGTKDAARQ